MISPEGTSENSCIVDDVFPTQITKQKIMFYTQSQSKRAWGTFVMPVKKETGQSFDNTKLEIHITSPEKTEPQRILVKLYITDDEQEYKTRLQTIQNSGFSHFNEVTFKNPFPKDLFTVCLGSFQYETYKKSFMNVHTVHVTVSSETIPSSQPTVTVYIEKINQQ